MFLSTASHILYLLYTWGTWYTFRNSFGWPAKSKLWPTRRWVGDEPSKIPTNLYKPTKPTAPQNVNIIRSAWLVDLLVPGAPYPRWQGCAGPDLWAPHHARRPARRVDGEGRLRRRRRGARSKGERKYKERLVLILVYKRSLYMSAQSAGGKDEPLRAVYQ